MAEPWWRRALVGMEVGPTGAQFGYSDSQDTRYAARFDGRAIVQHAAAAGAEYLVVWARDGDYAYYQSSLLPRAPGLGTRDPLREAVDAARPLGLPVIAYCVVQQGGHFLGAHPEYEMRDAGGHRVGRFCYNSGYLEAMKAIVAEQLAYGIAGFHLDMLDQGFGPPYGCWCDTCRRLFQEEFGRPMPAGATWDDDWARMLEFRYRSSERFEQALRAHIRALNPDATVDFNYHGNPPFSFEVGQRPVQHAVNADFVTGETGVWGFSALTVGLNAEFYRAATPGQPFQVAMQRGVRMYHDQTTRPLTDLRWELLTLLAHGAFVTMVDKTAFDGGLDPVAYERIGAAFADARARRAHFGQPPVAQVGLYFSARTRDWVAREKPAEYFGGFLGAQKAMVYEHILWGVVLDENATLGTLKRFAVVVLPNTGILTDRELGLLGRYVADGGNLIVTGLSGCFDGRGQFRQDSPLSELIGAHLTRRLESLDNWVRFPAGAPTELGNPVTRGVRTDWAFLVAGPAAVYQPTSARAIGELWSPSRTLRQQQGKEGTEWPMSAGEPVGPALLLNRHGRGSVLTYACSPDAATASEHAIPEARQLLANAVRWLDPNPRIRITAPVNVEAVVTDDPGTRTLRVHLLGYFAPPQTLPAKNRPYVLPALLEDPPLYRVTLECAFPVKSARAFDRGTELRRRGHRVEATVHDIHDVILLKY